VFVPNVLFICKLFGGALWTSFLCEWKWYYVTVWLLPFSGDKNRHLRIPFDPVLLHHVTKCLQSLLLVNLHWDGDQSRILERYHIFKRGSIDLRGNVGSGLSNEVWLICLRRPKYVRTRRPSKNRCDLVVVVDNVLSNSFLNLLDVLFWPWSFILSSGKSVQAEELTNDTKKHAWLFRGENEKSWRILNS